MQAPQTQVSTEHLLARQLLQEREIDRLLSLVREQQRELATLKGLDPQQAEIELLGRLKKLEIDATPGEAVASTEPTVEPKPQRGHGPRSQPELPLEEVYHELSEGKRRCPVCDEQLSPLGDQTEDSEEITIELKRIVKLRHCRQKYRCSCNAAVVTAPGPAKLIPGGRYSTSFAVDVAIGKVVDHLPLHRQVRILARNGLEVTRQTLWDQERALAEVLRPSAERIQQEILRSDILHADETGFLLTGRRGSKRQTLWVLSTQELAYYALMRKDFAAGKTLLGEYEGIVVADGYRVYEQLSRDGPFVLAHCWAHVLRKFRDASKHRPRECAQILALIGELYALEREAARDEPGNLEHRASVRDQVSRAKTAEIRRWALDQTGLPRSDFIKAVKYMLARWDGLTRFLTEPRLPLDNNRAENALRGPVIGRKNYLQFRSRKGCEVGAILFTLCESARLQGVSPQDYLQVAAERAIETPGTATLPSQI